MNRATARLVSVPSIAFGLLTAVGPSVSTQSAVPAPVTLAAVTAAMRADAVTTIEYSGSGYSFGYQQAPGPGEPWPLFIADTYHVSIDYAAGAMRLETTRAQGERPPRGGGGQPVKGNPRTITFVSGSAAWSQNERGAQPTPGALRDRMRQLWMTPHGVVKAAATNTARVNGRTLELSIEGLPVRVSIGPGDLVERIDYTIDSPVLGDVPVQLVYQDYKTVNGVPFPTRILEKTDGFLTLDIAVADVRPGAPVSIAVPVGIPASGTAPASAPSAPRTPSVEAVTIAPGVWQVTASGYASVLIEFRDFLVMFEAPIDDARSGAVQAWVKQTVPNKPTRYVVNTHAHFDHAGGLRWYGAEGVTIVTHEMNRSYYEQVWSRPRTLRPDRLSKEPRQLLWDTMTEKKVISDGSRTLELHKLIDNGHNPYLLIGYLPNEQLVLYGDMYNPPPGDDPRDLARTNEYAENLHDNIANRLKLSVRTLVPVHGRAVPFENLRKAIGR